MSRKRRRKKKPKAARRPSKPPSGAQGGSQAPSREAAGGSRSPDAALAKVARLTAAGRHRDAVREGKALHKRLGSSASEEVLVEAYAGRIREMLDAGLAPEADALIQLVRGRFPASAGRLELVTTELTAREGDLAALVQPLADPSLAPAKRGEIEATLRRILADPADLAACEALPPGHPLRVGARAAAQAFSAVTRGPVDNEAVALPEVSRRGPLAPWKWLVRAIAFFYRREDEACVKCLDAIEADSAAAHLVPAVRAMLDRRAAGHLPRRERELVDRVATDAAPLHQSVSRLDKVFRRGERGKTHRRRLLAAIRQAVADCRRAYPEAVETLRQRISVRAYLWGLTAAETRGAIGGSTIHDATFWRLLARAAEMMDGPAMACGYWEEFRKHAVHEGWFPADGVEAATVFRRMIRLLDACAPDEIAAVRRSLAAGTFLAPYYADQPPSVEAAAAPRTDAPGDYFLSPGELYARACAVDPEPQLFEDWMRWTADVGGVKDTEAVALRWGEAFPKSARPFLHLTEACEKRNALKRALKFLAEAEARDPVNPEVRRARLRLLAATAFRHIRNNKPHLLAKDCGQIEALPHASDGDRPAFLAALRCIQALLEGDRPQADRWRDEACRTLGEPAAHFLLARVHEATREAVPEPNFPMTPPDQEGTDVAAAAARACSLGESLGMPFVLEPLWADRIAATLEPSACTLDPVSLRYLIEAALRAQELELAYALSGVGLARGGPDAARFLLLRARSLPLWAYERRANCFDAVKNIAQRQRDTDLLAQAMDHSRKSYGRRRSWLDLIKPERPPMTFPRAQEVLIHETESPDYPDSVWDMASDEDTIRSPLDWLYDDDEDEDFIDEDFIDEELLDEEFTDEGLEEPCNCPACQRRRRAEARRADSSQPTLFDVDGYLSLPPEDDDDIPDLPLPPMPTAVLELMLDEFQRALENGEEPNAERILDNMPDELRDELIDDVPGFRKRKKRRPKKRK